jgi:hypothetical protein
MEGKLNVEEAKLLLSKSDCYYATMHVCILQITLPYLTVISAIYTAKTPWKQTPAFISEGIF